MAIIDPSHATEPHVLFVRPRDREMETWNGYRAGVEGAQERFGARAAFPIGELATELRKRLVGRQVLHYRRGGSADVAVDAALGAMRGLAERYGRTTPTAVVDPTLYRQRTN